MKLDLPEHGRLLIAFSGGLDSTALLLLASRQVAADRIHAVHVHHGLHPDADTWVAHCRQVARSLDLSITIAHVEPDSGSETEARRARYRAFEGLLGEGDWLLTAHHEADQAETLLLNLSRGTGVQGLAGMPRRRALGDGMLLRPLLDWRRQDLRKVVEDAGVAWIEDSGNTVATVPRNRIRHDVLPTLEEFAPAATSLLARAARHCHEAATLIEDYASRDLAQVLGLDPRVLYLARLSDWPPPRQRAVLRCWFDSLDLPNPDQAQLQQLLRQLDAGPDREVLVAWPGAEVRRYRDSLFASAPLRFPDANIRLDFSHRQLELPHALGTLVWMGEAPQSWPKLEVRFAVAGAQLRLRQGGPSRRLNRLFQETGVPPWERRRLPYLFNRQNQLVGVGDLWFDHALWDWMQSEGVMLRLIEGGQR